MKTIINTLFILFSVLYTTLAKAVTVDVTTMTINSIDYIASGELTSINSRASGQPYGAANGIFYTQPWDAWAVEFFDDTSGTTLHYEGIDLGTGAYFDYAFTLTEGQFAWGMQISFAGTNDHPVLNLMNCGTTIPGAICTGISTPMQGGPFPGVDFSLSGLVSPVPLPAAVWLFSSGFLFLSGIFHIVSHTSKHQLQLVEATGFR